MDILLIRGLSKLKSAFSCTRLLHAINIFSSRLKINSSNFKIFCTAAKISCNRQRKIYYLPINAHISWYFNFMSSASSVCIALKHENNLQPEKETLEFNLMSIISFQNTEMKFSSLECIEFLIYRDTIHL